MHWLGRIFVWLILMALWLALIAYAAQFVDMFDQPAEYVTYIRVVGMVIIFLGVLFTFGIVWSHTDVANIQLAT